jgi:hypothetical protein
MKTFEQASGNYPKPGGTATVCNKMKENDDSNDKRQIKLKCQKTKKS